MCSFETPSYLGNISPCLLSPDPRLQLNPLPAHRPLSLFHHRAVETSFIHLSTPQPKNRTCYSGASFRNRRRRCPAHRTVPNASGDPPEIWKALSDTRGTEKLATHSLNWIMLENYIQCRNTSNFDTITEEKRTSHNLDRRYTTVEKRKREKTNITSKDLFISKSDAQLFSNDNTHS